MTHSARTPLIVLIAILPCLLTFLLSPPVLSQVAKSNYPFGSYNGGPDVINLGNLNSHLTIPIIRKPGRGMPFTYSLSLDNSVWYPAGASGNQSWQPVGNWGWTFEAPVTTGSITWALTNQFTLPCNPPFDLTQETVYVYSNWNFTDKFGTGHPFSVTVYGYNTGCAYLNQQGFHTSATQTAYDGSGYVLTATSAPGGSVVDPRGSVIGSSSSAITDRNGNKITAGTNGVFTDTLGTTALTVAGSGTPSSPYLFTYTPPAGGTAQYKMVYTSHSIQTNFGCSGITEYGANGTTTANLVSEIDLPDGTKYTFGYEATPGHSGFVTGRLASVTLPTGGTISYSYSGGNNGINCADGSTATLTRTTPDGTWTYASSQVSGNHWHTKMTTPADSQNSGSIGDDTVIDFQKDNSSTTVNYYETQRTAYQGSSTSGTLLRTTTICYNTNTTNCSTTAVSSPITQRNITTSLPGSKNLQSGSIYKYTSSGSLTEQDDYDWGSGAIGSLLKKTAITYATLTNITAFRQQVTVTDGSGTIVSQTNYNYGDTVTATSGTPQHTTPSGSRGNLLSVNYYTHGSTYLTKSMSYFDTGILKSVTDVNGAQTTYTITSCGNSYPTSVSEPLSLSRSMTWNCTGGVQLTAVDENTKTSTSSFVDPYFWRPASVTDPASAVANLTYTSQTQTEAALNFNGTSSTSDAITNLDGLGRRHVSQIRETPSGSNFDSTETDYDTFGRVSRITLPYVGTLNQTSSTAPAQTTTYDAQNRVLQISDASGGYRSYSYTQNDVFITRGPAPSGENTKRRQEEFDAMGRLTSVCELTSATGSGSCAQNTAQIGFWTKYTYDPLGRITGVTQNAQSGSTQTRTYVYDLLGRLTSETNPENGTTTYVYDTDTTCGTSNGDLVKKVDAVGNVTCSAYDALHRPTAITYPSGSYSANTPAKHFVYDAATVNSVAMSNTKGRLAEAYTCTGSCTTKITDEGFSYTVRGETSDVYESTPHSGGYYHVTAQYWANSALKQLSGVPGLPTMTYTPDGEGRLYQVAASSGQNPVTNTVFNAASLPTSITYGSGDSDSYTYDPNTNRLTQYKFTIGSTPQSLVGNLTWNADHTLASQNITDPFDSSDQQNCSYTHDDLTRIASVNCGSIFSQTFSYDSFGNISKSGTYSFQPTYSSSTNRMISLGGATPSYDANGSILSDGVHTYTWASDGKSVSVDGVILTFDALGRMVEQNRSGTYTEILYGPRSTKLALMNGQTLTKGLVGLPGGGQAVYNSSGLLYYGHADHLGSVKLGSTPSTRAMYFDIAYAPFGETYATAGTTDPAFTGQRQDTVSGLYDFPARQYAIQGRWSTPDPSGLTSVSLSDPQTLNRYAYVRNNPMAMVDPNGLCGGDEDDLEGEEGYDAGEFCQIPVGGGGGSQDPTSGGSQANSGQSCGPDDAPCLGNDPANPTVDPLASLAPPPSQPAPPYEQYPSSVAVVGEPFAVGPTAYLGCDARCTGAGASVTYQVLDQNGVPMMVEGIQPTEITNPPIQSGQYVKGNEDAGTCVLANCGGTNSMGQYTDVPLGFSMAAGGSFAQQQNFVYNHTSYFNGGNITWTQTSSNGIININGSGTSNVNVCYPTKCP